MGFEWFVYPRGRRWVKRRHLSVDELHQPPFFNVQARFLFRCMFKHCRIIIISALIRYWQMKTTLWQSQKDSSSQTYDRGGERKKKSEMPFLKYYQKYGCHLIRTQCSRPIAGKCNKFEESTETTKEAPKKLKSPNSKPH